MDTRAISCPVGHHIREGRWLRDKSIVDDYTRYWFKKGFVVDPLAPAEWDYLVLDNLRYRGHDVSIAYRRGEGLEVTVDGKPVARRADLGRLVVDLSPKLARWKRVWH